MQGALVAGWVAGVADDSEDGLMGLLRVDSHEVADLHTASAGFIAAHDIVDIAGVDVAPRIALVVIGNIGEGGLRDVVARERILRPIARWDVACCPRDSRRSSGRHARDSAR